MGIIFVANWQKDMDRGEKTSDKEEKSGGINT